MAELASATTWRAASSATAAASERTTTSMGTHTVHHHPAPARSAREGELPYDRTMKILVLDVGGHNVKVRRSGNRGATKIPSGPDMTAAGMARAVLAVVRTWQYDAVTIGYPGPVSDNRPTREPHNLAGGWMRYDFARAFGRPVRIINDAAMQALGSYEGGRMLYLGLGTGL